MYSVVITLENAGILEDSRRYIECRSRLLSKAITGTSSHPSSTPTVAFD